MLTSSDPTSHSICPCWHTKSPVKQSCILSKGYLTQEACLTSQKRSKKKRQFKLPKYDRLPVAMKKDTNSHLHAVDIGRTDSASSLGRSETPDPQRWLKHFRADISLVAHMADMAPKGSWRLRGNTKGNTKTQISSNRNRE